MDSLSAARRSQPVHTRGRLGHSERIAQLNARSAVQAPVKGPIRGLAPYSSEEESSDDDQDRTYSPIMDDGEYSSKHGLFQRAQRIGVETSNTSIEAKQPRENLYRIHQSPHQRVSLAQRRDLSNEKKSFHLQHDDHDGLSLPNSPAFPTETASPLTPNFMHSTMVLPSEITDAEALSYHQQVQSQQEHQLLRSLSMQSTASCQSYLSDAECPVETALIVNYRNPHQRPSIVSVSPSTSTVTIVDVTKDVRQSFIEPKRTSLKIDTQANHRVSMHDGFPAAEATEFTIPVTPADDARSVRDTRFSMFTNSSNASVDKHEVVKERQLKRLNHAQSMQSLDFRPHLRGRSQSSHSQSSHSSITSLSIDRPALVRTHTDGLLMASNQTRNPNLRITVHKATAPPSSASAMSKQRLSAWLSPDAVVTQKNPTGALSPSTCPSSATTNSSFLSSLADTEPSPAFSTGSTIYSPRVAPIEEAASPHTITKKKSFSRFRSPSISHNRPPIPNINTLPPRKESLPLPTVRDPNAFNDAASINTTSSGKGGVLNSMRKRRTTLTSNIVPSIPSDTPSRPTHIPIVPKIDTAFINNGNSPYNNTKQSPVTPGALKRMGTKMGWGKK